MTTTFDAHRTAINESIDKLEESNITGEMLSEAILSAADPLTTTLVGGNDAEEFYGGITRAVHECESTGGYVEDIKLSTAAAAYGKTEVAYTALVMCRVPKDEEETAE